MFSSFTEESRKNSWKDSRPTRATESREVSAKADTARLISVKARSSGTPILPRKDEIAVANTTAGVPLATTPPLEIAPTAISATTASRLSSSMAPKDTGSMCFSFLICLDAVPEDTSAWKPLTAPQAMVTNRIGNICWPFTVKPLKAFRFISGLATTTPTRAAAIIATSR